MNYEVILNDLMSLVQDSMGATFFGMTAGQMLIGFCIMIAFLILRKLFARFVIARLKHFTTKTKTDLDDKFIAALENPLKFIPIILGLFFFAQYFSLPMDIATVFLTLTKSMVAFVVFWGLFNILNPLSDILECGLARLTKDSETLFAEEFTGLIVKGLKIAIISTGVIIVLSQWGVNVIPLLGGLGIVGMAIGFGAQDTIANIFGGIKILMDGQFKRGDWILTPDVEGTVMQIGISTTKLRGFDKAVFTVPNKQLAESYVKNYTKMTNRRVKLTIGVIYSTTSNQLENITNRIRKYLQNNPDIAQPGKAPVVQMVHLVDFGASSIDISLYYFTKTTKWQVWRDVVHENILEFKRIVEDEGSEFAFPSSSVYLESTPDKPKLMEDVELKEFDLHTKGRARVGDGGEEGGE